MARKDEIAKRFMANLEPHQPVLESYCRRFLYDRNDIADVLQSAISNSFEDFHRFVEGTNFRAWVFRFVHLEIQNANRKHHRLRHSELPQELTADEIWDFALNEPLFKVLLKAPGPLLQHCDQELTHALMNLNPLERAVVLLRAIGEFRYREIAEILQVPIGTVMSCLARARLRLRQQLIQFGREHGWLKLEKQ